MISVLAVTLMQLSTGLTCSDDDQNAAAVIVRDTICAYRAAPGDPAAPVTTYDWLQVNGTYEPSLLRTEMQHGSVGDEHDEETAAVDVHAEGHWYGGPDGAGSPFSMISQTSLMRIAAVAFAARATATGTNWLPPAYVSGEGPSNRLPATAGASLGWYTCAESSGLAFTSLACDGWPTPQTCDEPNADTDDCG